MPMPKITESDVENLAIELLENQGYVYVYGPAIAPDSETPQRSSFEEVVLIDRLRKAVVRINPKIPEDIREDAIKQILRLNSPDPKVNNENFHRLLTEGINVTHHKDGSSRGDYVWLIDFNNIENNEFVVLNQLTIIENNANRRPDVILYVNGLPLVVIELKNPAEERASVNSAFRQLQSYKQDIPNLFTYNAFMVASDALDTRLGTISAGFSRFMKWKSPQKLKQQLLVSELEEVIKEVLNKKTLLDLIRHFIVYEEFKKVDKVTNITSIEKVKKMAAYHQYYAVNRAIESTLKAASAKGDRKAGVVWHTQGSGKSLSMVFYTGKAVLALDNPTILVITDRNDLDDQLFDTFGASKQLLRQEPVQAENRDHLKKLLKVASGGVVFATIQKFQPLEGNVYETLSERRNIIVIADEAHRTQYGFKAKTIDDKDDEGNVVGKKTVYGFAKYMRDALPNATYLGFTGTPIESKDVNTPAVFGDYVDVYDIAQAVTDGATVKIYYESRLAKINLTDQGKKLVKELDDELADEDLSDSQKAKAKWTQLEALVGSKDRMEHIAKDIVSHFEKRQEVFEGKAMIVAMSRRIAANLYNEIIKLKPEWHDKDLKKGSIKVVMTSSSSDGPEISKHHTSKEDRRALADRMRDPEDELKLVIVRDMWLTGFDVPCLHTLYLDKPMKGHNLMQAIARVNRVYKNKPGGLVVDYLGIASDLKEALSFYSESGGKGNPAEAQEQAVAIMHEKLEVVRAMFHGFNYQSYFSAATNQKLSLILSAEEHILNIENGKKRFLDAVTALSGAFAIAVPHDEAMDAKDEIAYFQAVKARLSKFDTTGTGRTDEELESAIKQVIDQALVTDKVIDIFDAAGIKKPDISILSEEFLLEVKNMKHKNLALETLHKLLNDEIKARLNKNLVQGRTLMEMLVNSIKNYHNKILTAAEVIDELIKLAKDIKTVDAEPKAMGLSDFEYAFYTAVANNDSAKELMGKDKLRELAVVLFQKVKENASIDWTIKESVKAKLKVIVKRILRQFGYPPDMEALATETVMKQAELIAEDLTK